MSELTNQMIMECALVAFASLVMGVIILGVIGIGFYMFPLGIYS